MKKVNLFIVSFFIITSSLFSCSSEFEPIDPAVQFPDDNNDEDNDNGISTGNYWPMAVNNQWVFNENGLPQEPMKIISTQIIDDNTYYKYNNFVGTSTNGAPFSGTVMSRKMNGVYYYRAEVIIPGTPTITVSPLEIIVLKDFLEVDETWTQSLTQTTTVEGSAPITTSVQIEGKILEREASLTIGSVTYTDIIRVELVQTTQGIINKNYYWFAKDIGLVKYRNVLDGTNTISELQSYTLN
ncbi:MAG TPA: hypothetical protein P5335_08675 [Flavobacterium sp.]|nr:hypothetical protein [Flavobacterium sp.]